MLLGGYAAEKIIFGEERITDGCESDISRATGFVMTMVRSSGMGGFPASYQVKSHETPEYLHDTDDVVNASGKEILQKGLQLAEKTLTRERELLLHMADYLSDHRMMDKTGILACLKTHSVLYSQKQTPFSYRNYLKTLVQKPVMETDGQIFTEAVLNKDKKSY
jgi:cell division protease FtsH